MKNKEPEITEAVLEKMARHIDEPMNYKQLVESLGLKEKTSDSKAAQLKRLASYCELEVTKSPTRYIIHDVYNGMAVAMEGLNANNKFQRAFDVKLLRALAEHNGEKFYISNTELYQLFDEVNENFPYAMNQDNMELLGMPYSKFPSIGAVVKRILHEWTDDRMAHMEGRMIFISRAGFRVYQKIDNIRIEMDVPADPDLEKLCQSCFSDAADKIMPDDWGDKKRGRYPVAPAQYKTFYEYMNMLLEQRSHGEYVGMSQVKIISPQHKEYLDKLIEREDDGNLPNINKEVQRKIIESRVGDFCIYKPVWKQNFIDVNIKPNPDIILRNEIAKKKAELDTEKEGGD